MFLWNKSDIIRYFNSPELPIEVLTPLSDQTIVEHHVATFQCELNRPNVADVCWTKNGNTIPKEDAHYKITSEDLNYTLIILDCTLEDGAEYSITIGDVCSSASLTVEGQEIYIFRSGSYRIVLCSNFILRGL